MPNVNPNEDSDRWIAAGICLSIIGAMPPIVLGTVNLARMHNLGAVVDDYFSALIPLVVFGLILLTGVVFISIGIRKRK